MSVYEIVTAKIIALLEAGVVPWKKPWFTRGSAPCNLVSKREYRGINLWLLPNLYSSRWFATAKQVRDLGGTIKADQRSHGHMVVFWRIMELTDANGKPVLDKHGKPETARVLRYYTVWNVEQCQCLAYPPGDIEHKHDDIDQAEQIIAGMPLRPRILHDEASAYYRPSSDTVNVPAKWLFSQIGEYYCTLFHELGHATGHAKRLDRKCVAARVDYGSKSYVYEELVAELCAGYLCNVCGITQTIENSAAYIGNWLSAIKEDKRLLVNAAASAQKATDYILDKEPAKDDQTTTE